MNKAWPHLLPGDIVDIIAPSAKWVDGQLAHVAAFLEAWGFVPRISEIIYGPDLLCANTDEHRLADLISALTATDSKAVWCLRGGYGCTRLIPQLATLPIPTQTKLFIGLSDISALHIFLQDHWHWQTLHAASASQVAANKIALPDILMLKKIFGAQQQKVIISLQALNDRATTAKVISATVTGGNLSIIQTSLATAWQIKTANKILLLEEINERAYRIDRMLTHLTQAKIFEKVAAVILGDFIGGQEPNGTTLVADVIHRFAEHAPFPVYHAAGVGHGLENHPLPLGCPAEIVNADEAVLKIPLAFV